MLRLENQEPENTQTFLFAVDLFQLHESGERQLRAAIFHPEAIKFIYLMMIKTILSEIDRLANNKTRRSWHGSKIVF